MRAILKSLESRSIQRLTLDTAGALCARDGGETKLAEAKRSDGLQGRLTQTELLAGFDAANCGVNRSARLGSFRLVGEETARLSRTPREARGQKISGKMCRSSLPRISSVQALARVRAASRRQFFSIVCNRAESPLDRQADPQGRSAVSERPQHENCSSVSTHFVSSHPVSTGTRTLHSSSSQRSEVEKPGYHTPHSSLASDLGSRLSGHNGFEWILSQPSRRDSQCVPT